MTKEVRKTIMIRSKLRNRFLKDKNEQSRNHYWKECNLFVPVVCGARQQWFCSLDLSLIVYNKNFWKTVKPIFSDSFSHRDIIDLLEDGKTITQGLQIAEIFNNYFSDVICSLCDQNVPMEPSIACSQNTVSTAINQQTQKPSQPTLY